MNTIIPNISICGYGYVGGAMGHLCDKNQLRYKVYDINVKNGEYFTYYNSLENLVKSNETGIENDFNYYFIAVPTPSDSNGNCDTSIVEKVLVELNQYITQKSIILIKSTVRPGTTRFFCEKYGNDNLKIVFCPEFLRELSYKDDIYNTNFTMFGMKEPEDKHIVNAVTNLYKNYLYKHKETFEIYTRTFETCEIFKYTVNVFLSVKVWFFNEVYDVCQKLNTDYNSVRELLHLDSRIGMSHTLVPGVHGRGFYGTCFPKDCLGFFRTMESLDIPTDAIEAIINRNNQMRNEK